jgi:major intracellular serine protease
MMTLDRPGAARRVSAAVLALALAAPAVVPLADSYGGPGSAFAQEEDDTSDDESCEVVDGGGDDDDDDGVLFCAGQVTVRLQPEASVGDLPQEYQGAEVATIAGRNVLLLEVDPGQEETAATDLADDPEVLWAELNFVGNAPQGNPSRFFPRVGGDNAPVKAKKANSYGRGLIGASARRCVDGRGVTVAVIDTGLELNHPFIRNSKKRKNRVVQPWNAFTEESSREALADIGDNLDNDPAGDDGEGGSSSGLIDEAVGHGTHVAGVVLQAAPRASVMPIKALDSDGVGQAFFLAKAIARAVDQNADVINLSLGATATSRAVEDAVAEAVANGIVVVAAAGNAGGIEPGSGAVVPAPPEYPAATDNVIGVGATDRNDAPAVFSSRYDLVDLSAPGVDIASAFPRGAQGVNSQYARWSGTSMAAPWVAGAAALLLDFEAGQSPAQIAQALTTSAAPFDPPAASMGSGRVDVRDAIDCPRGGGKKGKGGR